jgi:hypothetical protein
MGSSNRRWDGGRETEADTRFFDLRESGYTGPIDQEGYPVTAGQDARILRDMAAARGEDTSWWTGDLTDQGPGLIDQGPGSRVSALAAGVVLVVVLVVVVTAISHLRGW